MNELTEKKKSVFDMDANEMLDTAEQMQQDDLRMLEEANATIEDAKNIGMETIEKLDRQNEQLDNAIDDTRKIQEDLKLAAKELRVISTKMATDKFISIVIVVLTVMAVVVVVIMVCAPKGKEIVEKFK